RTRDYARPAVGEVAELLRRQPQVAIDDSRAIGVARRRHLEQQRNAHPRSFWISAFTNLARSVTHVIEGRYRRPLPPWVTARATSGEPSGERCAGTRRIRRRSAAPDGALPKSGSRSPSRQRRSRTMRAASRTR